MEDEKTRKRLPPYVSYRTFRTFLTDLQEGVPARIDRSYWGDRMSGTNGTQSVAALRYMGLVDATGTPNNLLKQLLAAPRGSLRLDILKQLTSQCYAFILQSSFDPQTATYKQLEEIFESSYQLTGDVTRKCTKFFIEMAKEAGIPISPHILKKSGIPRSTAGTKKISRRTSSRTNIEVKIPQEAEEVPVQMSWDKMLLSKFPAFDPAWNDEVKLKWFQAFDELLKRRVPGTA